MKWLNLISLFCCVVCTVCVFILLMDKKEPSYQGIEAIIEQNRTDVRVLLDSVLSSTKRQAEIERQIASSDSAYTVQYHTIINTPQNEINPLFRVYSDSAVLLMRAGEYAK